MNECDIRWPPDLLPAESPVHTRNELRIRADPSVVWAWLVRAQEWPRWYSNCKDVRFQFKPGPDLAMGTRFSWTTFGVRVDTTVQEFVAPRRLAWRGSGLGACGYHAWVLEPLDGGCHVITEETQAGLVPSLARAFLRRGLLREHQSWLEGLARVARGGLPPDVARR
jgi:uncharacterized protein YndB with AHSA1/START domain